MAMGINSPELLMKNMISVIMAGVLGIYGLIVSIILNGKMEYPDEETGMCRWVSDKERSDEIIHVVERRLCNNRKNRTRITTNE